MPPPVLEETGGRCVVAACSSDGGLSTFDVAGGLLDSHEVRAEAATSLEPERLAA